MYVRDRPAKATCILESSNKSNWYLHCYVLAAASAVPWADVWGWSRTGVPSAFSHLRTQAQIAGCILSPMRERAREKGWGEHWPTSPLAWGGARSLHTHISPCLSRVFFPWAGCVFPDLAVPRVSQQSLAHGSAVGYCCCRKRTDALRELKCNIKWLPMLCPAGLLQPFPQGTFAEYLLRWLCTGRCFSSPWAGQVW